MPRKAHLIKKLQIKLSGYDTKLTPFVARGPCASQGSLDQKTSNQAKWVSVPLMKVVFLEMSDDEKQ